MFEYMVIDPAVKKLWEKDLKENPNTPELNEFMDAAVDEAKKLFPKKDA